LKTEVDPKNIFHNKRLSESLYDVLNRNKSLYSRIIELSVKPNEDTFFVCGKGFESNVTWFPVWMNAVDGKLMTYINVSHYSKCNEDSQVRQSILLGLLLGAAVLRLSVIKQDMMKKSLSLLKETAAVYSKLAIKVLDRQFGLSLNKNDVTKTRFLLAKFYLVYQLGLDSKSERTDQIAVNVLNRDESVLAITGVDSLFSDEDYHDPVRFFHILGQVVSKMNGLSFKVFLLNSTQMYGEMVALSLEYFPYFLFLIVSVSAGASLFNSFATEQYVAQHEAAIIAAILQIAETH
jgi:hypothetical protein